VKTEVVHSIEEIRRIVSGVRRAGRSVGLVPTMGALHAGHGRLIEAARRESDFVVASIFVNPAQFDRDEDYSHYPRTLASDVEFCAARGVDAVFAPSVEEMYPRPQRTFVDVKGVSEHLCGRSRTGHFRGVATVVLKLLNIMQPDRAYFGEKDAQQLAVIRRMAADLNVACTIVEVPTVRDADGLALSSRNEQLSAGERLVAPVLSRALQAAEALIAVGATSADEIRRAAMRVLAEHPEVTVEYLEIVDPDEMQPVEQISGPVRVAGAVWVGKTRLIDNVLAVAGTSNPVQAARR
jgi:pantoate--beta-alanine ligase